MLAQLTLFDLVANIPQDELRLINHRTYSEGLNECSSLRGRAVCMIRIATHLVGIGLKPSYYFLISIINKLVLYIIGLLSRELILKIARETGHEEIANFTNKETLERYQKLCNKRLMCVMVAPFSQVMQLFKAVLGVIHPGCYFKDNPFIPHFRILAKVAREVECPKLLIDCLDNGPAIIHQSLKEFPYSDFYAAEFLRDLAFITEKLDFFRN